MCVYILKCDITDFSFRAKGSDSRPPSKADAGPYTKAKPIVTCLRNDDDELVGYI